MATKSSQWTYKGTGHDDYNRVLHLLYNQGYVLETRPYDGYSGPNRTDTIEVPRLNRRFVIGLVNDDPVNITIFYINDNDLRNGKLDIGRIDEALKLKSLLRKHKIECNECGRIDVTNRLTEESKRLTGLIARLTEK